MTDMVGKLWGFCHTLRHDGIDCGESVPTEAELARREGRSYEPASTLLARIKAERAERGTNLKPVGRSALKSRPKKVLTKSIN